MKICLIAIPATVLATLLLILTAGCDDASNITGPDDSTMLPPPEQQITGVEFLMVGSNMDYKVYVDGSYRGRLNRDGAHLAVNLGTGGHWFRVYNVSYGVYSQIIEFTLINNQRRYFAFGIGDQTLDWQVKIQDGESFWSETY